MKILKALAAPKLFSGLVILALIVPLAGKANAAIYWGDGAPIGRSNLDGTEAQYEFIKYVPFGGEAVACGGIAVDASHVYWAEPVSGSIGRASLDGSSANYAFITGAMNPCGIAVDSAHIYWTSFSGGSIGRANLDGSNPTQAFITAIGQPCGVAVDHRFIYWTSSVSHYVGRALVDTGYKGPHLLDGDGSFDFCGLAVNQEHLFWGGFGDRIGRVNLDGSDPEPSFISGVEGSCGIAVDSGHIYWTEQRHPSRVSSADIDGTAVNRNILTRLGGGPCGIAVNSSLISRAPSLLRSAFDFGKVRHNKRRGIAFIPVDLPDRGYFRARVTSGASWTLLPDRVKGGTLSAGGRKWLKIWAGGKGGNGQRMRRQLRRRGRAIITIETEYSATGYASTSKGKRILLLSSPK